jgi:hypothetical protein
MSEIKDLLVGVLVETYKIDAEQLEADLFDKDGEEFKVKDDAKVKLLELDKQRIKKVADTHYQNAHKKFSKDGYTDYEAKIKAHFGIDSEKQGVDLIQDVIAAKAKPGEVLTDDAIKKHPIFLAREKQLTTEREEAVKAAEAKYRSEKTAESFAKQTLRTFKELKPILSTDPVKADSQSELFVERLMAKTRFEINGNEIILLNADGSRMEDGHGNAIAYDKYVKTEAAKLYDFEAGEKRSSGDDPGKKGSGSGDSKVTKPKDAAEFNQKVAEIRAAYANDPKVMNEKLLEITKLYNAR